MNTDKHSVFGDCNCSHCLDEAFNCFYDIDRPPRKSKKKKFQQKLKERYENGDSQVGTLGEPSGKFDYYVLYRPFKESQGFHPKNKDLLKLEDTIIQNEVLKNLTISQNSSQKVDQKSSVNLLRTDLEQKPLESIEEEIESRSVNIIQTINKERIIKPIRQKVEKENVLSIEIKIIKNRIVTLERMNKFILNRLEAKNTITPETDLSSDTFLASTKDQEHFEHSDSRQYIEICNEGKDLKTVKVYCKLQIGNLAIECLAIVDTGCTSTTINEKLIPLQSRKYIKKADKPVQARQFDGSILNYTDILIPSKISFKNSCENYSIEYNLPTTWVSSNIPSEIKLVLGLNFIFDNQGGLYLTRNIVCFPKQTDIIPILSSDQVKNIESKNKENCNCPIPGQCKRNLQHEICSIDQELITEDEELEELNFKENLEINTDIIYPQQLYNLIVTENDITQIQNKLEKLEIIGENPTKYWENDKIICKLDILNPAYKIRTATIEATPKEKEDFKMHIDELLGLKVIRKSDSEHRSAAFIVNKHSEQVRGKSRMVINYKRLNDNTRDDAYTIPDKNDLINSIQDSLIFSKFDCKSGFWQIKMHEESIPWTAFTCPEGHFEWLVMPFGLKTAPAVFQRKMDTIFKKYNQFCIVYIDDILVFSKTRQEHLGHLQIIFSEFLKHGIIISKKKIELAKPNIAFLGSEIGKGKIKLQKHIADKVLSMPDKLETLKELQAFLGLINYARPFIKNLGRIAGPLYSKTSNTGQRFFNQEDIKLVQNIKNLVKNLPELALPKTNDFLIVETDGSALGWGAILYRKAHEYADKNTEEISRYASGKYKEKGNISSIDAELLAVSYALDAFQLYLLNRPRFIIRTDCEAIVKFHANMNSKRSSKRRWLNFTDRILGKGFKISFEHIKGKENSLADLLSRFIFS